MPDQQSSRLARYNRTVVLDLIRRFGPISKTELADRTGLALSSVLNIVSTLTRRNLVRAVGVGPSTGGRPPMLVELNPSAQYAVGVNIRIGMVDAVLVDLVGDIVAETVLPVHGGMDVVSVTDTVVEAIDQLVRLGRIDPARFLGAGVGCPGAVTEGRVLVRAPALLGWHDVPLADVVERRTGLPVVLENDANLCALAELRHGVGKGGSCASLVYIFADHGIGEGIVIDGKLYRGSDGMAGELGHVVIDVDGPQCICGNYGCLEALASIGSIIRRTAVAAKLGASIAVDLPDTGDWDAVSYAAITEAVQQGDPVATSAVDEAAAYLAVGITNAIRELRPEIVVLGGGLFDGPAGMFERLQGVLKLRPALFTASATPVVQGELGARAAAIGAATLVLENFFGIPQQVMSSELEAQAEQPAFERTLVWPLETADSVVLARSSTRVRLAGNLRPLSHRVRNGQPVTVKLDVELETPVAADAMDVKVLLHWDRVALFGAGWPNPKNSPMQLSSLDGRHATFSAVLGSLPPGKYEYAARVLAANDLWVRGDGPSEPNGRLEVLSNRASTSQGDEADLTSSSIRKADSEEESSAAG
ncbi:MAG TPA: ROK family transcriptional regulator [Chloroflexota bacterium]